MAARSIALAIFGHCLAAGGALAATTVHTITHQGIERKYELFLPETAGASGPRPLVIGLHGHKQSLERVKQSLGFQPVARREGFAIAYPEAVDLRWSYGRPIIKPMPSVGGTPVDDVGLIGKMIFRLVDEGVVDPARIYAAGLSRGGLMTFTLACDAPERFAAVAPMITGMTDPQLQDCRPARIVPMLVLAGTADLVQRYDGWLFPGGRQASVPETIEFWRKQHGCTGQHARPLPDIVRDDLSAIGVVRWTGCSREGSLVYYRVFGGGHRLPSLAPRRKSGLPGRYGWRNRDIETAEEVWKFFRKYRLPD